MSQDTLQFIQVISSIVTPFVILLLGLRINKTLETNRTSLAKEKEWRTEWAKRFFQAAIGFNDAVDDCVLSLVSIIANSQEKLAGWEERHSLQEKSMFHKIEQVQRSEWILKTSVEFAINSKEAVLTSSSKVFSLTEEFLETMRSGRGVIDMEAIRETLFDFNKAAMVAHREILGK